MIKFLKSLLAFLFSGFLVTNAQTKNVVYYPDSVKIKILSVTPDSFPQISVFVKAETNQGKTISGVSKEKIQLKENGTGYEVSSIQAASKNRPIYLSILIDHSESMKDDYTQLPMLNGQYVFNYDSANNIIYSPGYKSPLVLAKESIKSFIQSFNLKKDFFSLLGFSRHIDVSVPLTQNTAQLHSYLDAMKLDTGIAMYDALITGMHEIKSEKGIKAVVVLTDGHDNHSKHNWYDVVLEAKREEIPIYIIGIGNVSKNTLQSIADSTGGQFYFCNPLSLGSVYSHLSKQIQSIYEVTYNSSNYAVKDSLRKIELSLGVDNFTVTTEPKYTKLSAEVLLSIEKQQKQKMYLLFGGVSLSILIIALALFLLAKRRKKIDNFPSINKLHPNPTTGIINLDISNGEGNLQIMDLKWKILKTFELGSGQTKFDVSELDSGTYLAIIKMKSKVSNAIKFVIHK